jgi:phosphonate transport system permease protein
MGDCRKILGTSMKTEYEGNAKSVLNIANQNRARARRRKASVLVLLFIALAACFGSDVFSLDRYSDSIPTVARLLRDAIPPDFSRWASWILPLGETVLMSIAGTTLAGSLALPIAFFAARNTTPFTVLIGPLRLVMSILRTVPDILMAALLVAVLGFGTLPGVVALTLHSIGMLGKFYAETIEHVDPGPANAILSQDGSKLQAAWFAILPEIIPRLADVSLYRWEHNLRAAMMMGLVGAGGLGLELVTALKLFEYQEAAALLIITVSMVGLVDSLGGRLRAYFLGISH